MRRNAEQGPHASYGDATVEAHISTRKIRRSHPAAGSHPGTRRLEPAPPSAGAEQAGTLRVSTVTDEISPHHPALAGHFPGDPIVPGVVVLRSVCRAAASSLGAAIAGVPAVKFHAPLKPAEPFEIELDPRRGESVGFRVVRGETLIASGTLRLSRE